MLFVCPFLPTFIKAAATNILFTVVFLISQTTSKQIESIQIALSCHNHNRNPVKNSHQVAYFLMTQLVAAKCYCEAIAVVRQGIKVCRQNEIDAFVLMTGQVNTMRERNGNVHIQ